MLQAKTDAVMGAKNGDAVQRDTGPPCAYRISRRSTRYADASSSTPRARRDIVYPTWGDKRGYASGDTCAVRSTQER
jgi:hypothetical protein